MDGSWMVEAQEAVVALLRAQSGLDGVQIEYCWPGDNIERESIYGGGDVDFTSEIAAMREGRKTSDEEFTLDFALETFLEGSTQAEADRRALEMYGHCQAAIASTPRLGLADRHFLGATIARGQLVRFFNSNGRGARLVFGIRCKARLR